MSRLYVHVGLFSWINVTYTELELLPNFCYSKIILDYCPGFGGKLCPQGNGVRLEFTPPFTLLG
jgi:hypothetical protein